MIATSSCFPVSSYLTPLCFAVSAYLTPFSFRSELSCGVTLIPPCVPLRVASEGGRQNVVWILERHALRLRNRRRQRPQEWRSAVVYLPPQEHGVVLVDGVVAVLHEHPAPVAELQRNVYRPGWAEPPHVLAAPLRRGN